MTTNIEIEFKTAISKNKYDELLKAFNLESNVFKQTNYYFDTPDLDLNKKHIVLRIRQKGSSHFKVTLKSQAETGAYEYHVLLNETQAKEMIQNGFNTKDYFEQLDYFVTFKASLDNYRASTQHDIGTIFIDKCVYSGITEYEVEYEVENYEEGEKSFKQILKNYNIKFTKAKRKSERAISSKK